ncbi:MAG: DMT family transporter [Azospirillaceae bacterium]
MRLATPDAARIACVYAGFAFGLYWIPIRSFEGIGFEGLWAGVGLNALPFAAVLPMLALRARRVARNGRLFHLGTAVLGLAYALYVGAFVFTAVVNVFLLFYLLPAWGFLLGRLFLREALTLPRLAAVALGLAGIVLCVGGGPEGAPGLFDRPGDWMALAAGLCWAIGSLCLLVDRTGHALDTGCVFLLWSTVALAGIALAAAPALPAVMGDRGGIVPGEAIWLLLAAFALVLPASFATVIGPMALSPGTVGLLFMTEISVGTISAGLLSGEPLGARQLGGIAAITLAGAIEPLSSVAGRKR